MKKTNQIVRSDANADAGEVTQEMQKALEQYNAECVKREEDCRAQYEKQLREGNAG